MYRCRVWPTANFAIRSQRNRTQPLSGARNLIRFSEDQSNALWLSFGGSKLGNSTTIAAPDGTMTMNLFNASGATGIYQVFTANGFADARIGEVFTCSVWMATETGKSNSTQGGISYYNGIGSTYSGTFALTQTPTRFTFTFTNTAGVAAGSNITVESKVAGKFLWWGYQLERGPTMTQYTKRS